MLVLKQIISPGNDWLTSVTVGKPQKAGWCTKRTGNRGLCCSRNHLWYLGPVVQPVWGSCPSKHSVNAGCFLSYVGYLPSELYSPCFEVCAIAGIYLFSRMIIILCISLDSLYNVKDNGVFGFKWYYSFLETPNLLCVKFVAVTLCMWRRWISCFYTLKGTERWSWQKGIGFIGGKNRGEMLEASWVPGK